MVHRCLYGDAPSYLTPSAAATVRRGLRSATNYIVARRPVLAHLHRTNFREYIDLNIFIQSRFQFTLLGALDMSRHLRRPNLDFLDI